MPIRLILTLIVAATLMSGCGRRGPLEAPGAAAEPQPTFGLPIVSGNDVPSEPAADRNAGPDKPFILDPLL
jgi:predicted small lipoprotein YifL